MNCPGRSVGRAFEAQNSGGVFEFYQDNFHSHKLTR